MTPFLTFYTPTYRRPRGLARCLESVRAQTVAGAVEQIVIPDHVGRGIGGMYGEVPRYVDAVHGRYVHVLADDDVLAGPTAVAALMNAAREHGDPPAFLVRARKGPLDLPLDGAAWPPVCGRVDLSCFVTRADVWRPLARAGAYGQRYEGDYDFAVALATAGVVPVYLPLPFVVGGVSRGAPEWLGTEVSA